MTRGAWLRWGSSVAAFVLLMIAARRVEWGPILAALRQAAPVPVGGAVLVSLASQYLKGVAWWVFVRPMGVRSTWPPVRASFAGAALNNLLPWNAGDAVRVWGFASQQDLPLSRVIGSAALERLTGVVAGLLLLGGAVALVPLPGTVGRVARVGGTVLVILTGIYLLTPHVWVRTLEGSAMGRLFARPASAVRSAGLSRPRVAAALGLGATSWGLQLVAFVLAGEAVGLSPGLEGQVVLVATVNLGIIVRPTPGGVGVFQALYVAAAMALGLPEQLSLASSILLQTAQVIPVTVIGGVFLPGTLRRYSRPLRAAVGPGVTDPRGPGA